MSPTGGAGRISTKAKLLNELRILGEILAEARAKRGLKQAVVAARLGLPASYLSKIEKGTRRLDVIELVRIAEAMETDPSELVEEIQRRLAPHPSISP